MPIAKNIRIIAFTVISYMLIALIWWTMLLFKKNDEVYHAKKDLVEITNFSDEALAEIKKKHSSQKAMIIGEGLTFGIMLVIGILLILRSYNRELAVAQKENNFLLSITHELKSPIASIKLILDTFKKRKLSDDLFNELNENALEETNRLNALVGNLLYANKLNFGYDYTLEDIDFNDLVSTQVNHFKKKFKNFQFNFDSQGNTPARVDSDALKIVVNNMIENAIKYSDKEKIVDIELRKGKTIDLFIKDFGIGISKADKLNVFSKFYRVGSEETRDTKGTGLGLFISAEIIKGHGGQIKILDNEPKGTIFKITIPNTYDQSV